MLGVSSIEEARKIDADVVLDKAIHSDLPPHTWSAVIDDVFCKAPTSEWFLQPGHVECPLLMSSTDIEMNMSPRVSTRDELRALAESLNGVDVERFMAAFEGADDEASIRQKGQIAAIDLAIHAINRMGGRTSYRSGCAVSPPRFPVGITPAPSTPPTSGSIFETLAKCWRPFTGKHYDLARQMCDSWANFMRNGDPNGMGTDGKPLPEWPRLTPEHPVRMEFADTATATDAAPSPLMEVLLDAYVNTH